MKKTMKTILLSSLIVLLLLTSVPAVATAAETAGQTEQPLEERLIGTWRWEGQHSWIMVFREDGTLLDGPPGMRTTYNWQVRGDRLFVNGEDWNIRINRDRITVDRLGSTYSYVWYSDSTEGETSWWCFIVGGLIFLAVIALIIILIVRSVSRRRKRREQAAQNVHPGTQGAQRAEPTRQPPRDKDTWSPYD